MKNLSKNILLISLLVIVNLAIFILCKILTSEGNYLWGKTDPDKAWVVSAACLDLMRTQYFIYANSINVFLLGIYFAYYYRKTLGIIVMTLAVLIFLGGTAFFREEMVFNYYLIFKNQKVPDDFILEPIKSAGPRIGKYLEEDIRNRRSPHRKDAIAGTGVIKHDASSELLNEILDNRKENPEIRGEAYLALLSINSEKSTRYARIFINSTHPIEDQKVIDYINLRKKAY